MSGSAARQPGVPAAFRSATTEDPHAPLGASAEATPAGAGAGTTGAGSAGTGSAGAGSAGAGSAGTGSADTGSAGAGSAGTIPTGTIPADRAAAPADPLKLCVATTVAVIAWLITPPLAVALFAAMALVAYSRARRAGLMASRCALGDTRLVLAYLAVACTAGVAGVVWRVLDVIS